MHPYPTLQAVTHCISQIIVVPSTPWIILLTDCFVAKLRPEEDRKEPLHYHGLILFSSVFFLLYFILIYCFKKLMSFVVMFSLFLASVHCYPFITISYFRLSFQRKSPGNFWTNFFSSDDDVLNPLSPRKTIQYENKKENWLKDKTILKNKTK